jgi:hypothetical protein
MIKDTSGFYRMSEETLFFAPNAVRAPTYDLFRKDKDTYTYPVEGWYWFDTREAARAFFGLPLEPSDRG